MGVTAAAIILLSWLFFAHVMLVLEKGRYLSSCYKYVSGTTTVRNNNPKHILHTLLLL